MAQITTVRLTQGSVTAEVELEYRWYVPGNDPWRRVSGASSSMPASGDWENRRIGGSTTEVRMSAPSEGYFMKLMNFTSVRVGSRGQGEFYASGYMFRQYSTFDWEVISIR